MKVVAGGDIYLNLEKSRVIQEARVFSSNPPDPKRSRIVLTKLLSLTQSHPLTNQEATDLFFQITRLFQCHDSALRQVVYLAIKELASTANDIIMVTSSLTKDINSKSDLIYRPNAVRALAKIVDASMIQGIERFLKQSIVDKNVAVACAALVSSLHLFHLNKEIVKRWSNEVQEAIASKGLSAQYLALGLLYQIRSHDKMAVIKMGSLRSGPALCMLVRYTFKMMEEEQNYSMYQYLVDWLSHKNELVSLEAARAICTLREGTESQIAPAISVLKVMLRHQKPLFRFAAIRTLNSLAMLHPLLVSICNTDLEELVTDSNRSISTFAITTLLKTGSEQSVDRLMKQITGFMADISDDFKVIVIDAIRCLCLKFPSKHVLMLSFLKDVLRDEGGYEFKKAVVEAIFDIINSIPSSKEIALEHLCEFIEDCDFAKLSVRILHILGTEGPKTLVPNKYIRYIYNRVVLENAVVRAAAVSALAQFGEHLDSVRERIKILLERCTQDFDDEVRDRAVMYLRILNNHELAQKYIANDSTFAWADLEDGLIRCLENNDHDHPFDISSIQVISKRQENVMDLRMKEAASEMNGTIVDTTPTIDLVDDFESVMSLIPQLSKLGKLFKSSTPRLITEAEEEYVITSIRHIFSEHSVYQFDVKNTLNDYVLENISVVMLFEGDQVPPSPLFLIPISKLGFEEAGSIYAVYQRTEPMIGKFGITMKFEVRDCDPDSGVVDEASYPDEYAPEGIDIYYGDYIQPSFTTSSFNDQFNSGEICIETFGLTELDSFDGAVKMIEMQLGMKLELDVIGSRARGICSGVFVGGLDIFIKVEMVLSISEGVTMQISVSCNDAELSEKIANFVQ